MMEVLNRFLRRWTDPIITPTEKWLQIYRYRDDIYRECFGGPLDRKWVRPKSEHLNNEYDLVEDYYSERLYYVWKGSR